MEKINYRIQRNNNLNEVYFNPEVGPGNGYHDYEIRAVTPEENEPVYSEKISFQKGPRGEDSSRHGATEQDLLEIARHRLQAWQKGPYATRENACALTAIEEALMWMHKRTEDRAERGVLGTMEK